MSVLWIVLNDDKSAVIEVFETIEADSKPHWDKFFEHRAGNVFCRRIQDLAWVKPAQSKVTWFVNYFYWEDMSRWGYGDPTGMGWSACMAIPEILKMVEFLE
jgi:hypothetical protein